MFKNVLPSKKLSFAAPVVLFITMVDLVTKFMVQRQIAVDEEILLVKNHLRLIHVHNYGSAFGLFSHLSSDIRFWFFTIVFIVAVIVLIRLMRDTDIANNLELLAFASILGGAVGNFTNRIFNGHVTDFISVHWKSTYFFPAFNFADIAICAGVGILLLRGFLSNSKIINKELSHAQSER